MKWNSEIMQLRYLARQDMPIWGGHLQRNEECSDPDIPRWLANGLIERISNRGYVITRAGRRFCGLLSDDQLFADVRENGT